MPGGINEGKRRVSIAIAARGSSCFAGSAAAVLPFVSHVCMRTNGV
ncbi:MAG: hypothetical protein KAH09_00885 [Desulfobacula sp.]|nr:hypothetical protein [Desulfobacula sp.]